MVIEVFSFDELDVLDSLSDVIGESVDSVDEDSGEEEIWEDDDSFESEFSGMFEAWFDKREGDAGESDFCPSESEGFDEHSGDFGDIRVSVGVRRAAPNNDEACFMSRDFCVRFIGIIDSGVDSVSGGGEHFDIDSEFASILYSDVILCGVGIED